jgi:hypothetical protein
MAKIVVSAANGETPDAWAAFERAVDVVVKAPPRHRSAAKKDVASELSAIARRRSLSISQSLSAVRLVTAS